MSSCSTGLWYAGRINDTLTEEIIAISKSDTFETGISTSNRKLGFLMIESFQNIIRHGVNDSSNEPSKSAFGLMKTGGLYHIFSSNRILKVNEDSMTESINKLNSLSFEELNEAYREQLATGLMSAKGGAGLGLIEIRRKSGKLLQFNINEAGKFADFNLQIDYDADPENPSNHPIEAIEKNLVVKDLLHEKDIKLVFKGDFRPDLIAPVLKIFLRNLSSFTQDISEAKTLYEVGNFMLQNLIDYALDNEAWRKGLIYVKADRKQVQIVTMNYLDPVHYDQLTNELSNSSDRTLFKESLIGSSLISLGVDNTGLTVDSFKEDDDHIFCIKINIKLG